MSLIKHEILQPVRHFNMHDDPLTNIETLHLLIWDKGLCIAGYDAGGKVLNAKIYSFASWDIAAIESVFVNERLVAGPQPVTHIWIVESRNLVIPQHLYEEEAAGAWLKKFHFIEAGEEIKATKVAHELAATVVYPVSEKLELLLNKYFAEGRIDTLSGMILCQPAAPTEDLADIILLDQTALLTLYSKGKMLMHLVVNTGHINDLVYTLAAACQEQGIAQDKLRVQCSGLYLQPEVPDTLRSYFPDMQLAASEQEVLFTLLNRQLICAS